MQLKRSRLIGLLLILTGCAGLIGVPDLTLEEDLTSDGGLSDTGSSSGEGGQSLLDGNVSDGSKPITDGSADSGANDSSSDSTTSCDVTKLAVDANNCGRCGHSCLGGTCTNGLCDPTRLGIFSEGGLRFVAQHGDYLYASTFWRSFASTQGIYRIPKAGGGAQVPELFFEKRYVEQLTIVGDTLYFIINEGPYEGNDASDSNLGGVWSCDLRKPGKCDPQIVAIADNPNGLTAANGSIYFRNFGSDETIRKHAIDAGDIDASPVIGQTAGQTYLFFLQAVQNEVYALQMVSPQDNERAYLSIFPGDGGAANTEGLELSRYTNPNANPGGIAATESALFYAAYDFNVTTGGIIRRHPRAGAPAGDSVCAFNNGAERRPSGVFSDDVNVYWTNQGDFDSPYGNGSVAWCPAHGPCCATPNVIWRGEGEPVAITADDKFLYWVGYRSGEMFKVAKP